MNDDGRSAGHGLSVRPTGRATRVLVVHEDLPMRHLVGRSLTVAGHSVVEAQDVAGLLAGLAGADVAVVDARLAGARPDAVVALCRRMSPATRCVLLCTATEDVIALRSNAAEWLTVLAAPFGPRELAAVVTRPA